MEYLNTTVKLSGLGQAIESTQLQKHDNIYLYQREDNTYEVFTARVAQAGMVFNVEYPEREVYPNNEDFGKSAWCYTNKDQAIRKFNQLVEKRQQTQCS